MRTISELSFEENWDEILETLEESGKAGEKRAQILRWIDSHGCQLNVTLAFNFVSVSRRRMRQIATRFQDDFEEMIYGKSFLRRCVREDKALGFYFAEKLELNPHYHGAIFVHPLVIEKWSEDEIQSIATNALKKQHFPSADVRVEFKTPRQWYGYISKEFERSDFLDTLEVYRRGSRQ